MYNNIGKSIETEKMYWINTNSITVKCIENTQYEYFLKILKIQIKFMVKCLTTTLYVHWNEFIIYVTHVAVNKIFVFA